jgi:hypothetical protein
MRSKVLASVVLALLVAGCAQKGVVVEKRLKPSPFAYSNGLDAVYTFMLRGEQGRVHSQMVTPDVFTRYEVGDYFDDQQVGPVHREGFSKDSAVSDSKDVKPLRRRHTTATQRKHRAAVASRKTKRHQLRAAVKPREDEAQIVAPMIPHETSPDSRGLDVRP